MRYELSFYTATRFGTDISFTARDWKHACETIISDEGKRKIVKKWIANLRKIAKEDPMLLYDNIEWDLSAYYLHDEKGAVYPYDQHGRKYPNEERYIGEWGGGCFDPDICKIPNNEPFDLDEHMNNNPLY